jgi:hypothetical protein
VLAFVLMAALGAQTPAHANPITILDATCYWPDVCLFEDDNYYGDKYVRSGRDQHAWEIGGWNGDNEISSVKNYSSWGLCLYEDDEQEGEWIRIPAGGAVADLDAGHDFDNDAESARLTAGNC